MDDHKYRIDVGYGLEGILPDGKVGDIGREMVPDLRANDYDGAVTLAVGEMAQVIAADAKVTLDDEPATASQPASRASQRGARQTDLCDLRADLLWRLFYLQDAAGLWPVSPVFLAAVEQTGAVAASAADLAVAAALAEEVVAAALAALAAAALAAAEPGEAGRVSKFDERGSPAAEPEEKRHCMSKGLWIALGVVGVLVLAVLMVFSSYVSARNQMVAKDQTVKATWSEVDVQLERRADLIPNLVETVKGFTKEESTVFGDIANARAGMLNAQGPAGQDRGQRPARFGAIGRLLLLTENYPQLRSSDQFMRLQDELAGTENRIGVARKRYNDAIQDYNTFILQFPNNIWAGIAGFKENDAFFKATPAAQAVPSVKF